MSSIILLDTSVYLNILNVPGNNQDRQVIFAELQACIIAGDHFLLPLAAVWETGNHIADLHDGQTRRRYAEILRDDVTKAFMGEVPYKPTFFPERDIFLEWLQVFPDYAMKNKSVKKTREGVSLADLSIIKEWERVCNINPMTRVRIWSLDGDLEGYDREV